MNMPKNIHIDLLSTVSTIGVNKLDPLRLVDPWISTQVVNADGEERGILKLEEGATLNLTCRYFGV